MDTAIPTHKVRIPPVPRHDRLDTRGIERPAPAAQQVPRPFALILLRGLQTRWYDTAAELKTEHDKHAILENAHLMFRYEPLLGRYHEHTFGATTL